MYISFSSTTSKKKNGDIWDWLHHQQRSISMLFDQLQAEPVDVCASCMSFAIIECFLLGMLENSTILCVFMSRKSFAARVAMSKQDRNKTPYIMKWTLSYYVYIVQFLFGFLCMRCFIAYKRSPFPKMDIFPFLLKDRRLSLVDFSFLPFINRLIFSCQSRLWAAFASVLALFRMWCISKPHSCGPGEMACVLAHN